MTRSRQVNGGEGFGSFFGEAAGTPARGRERRGRTISIPLPERRTSVDALLPLINIVFLLLIFLMMSGTIGTPLPGGVDVARSLSARDPAVVAEALVVRPDGSLAYRGAPVAANDLLAAVRAAGPEAARRVTVIADGDMGAADFLAVMRRLSDGGVETISLVTAEASPGAR